MRQNNRNQPYKAQDISFLAELTDDEAKNVEGGRWNEERPDVVKTPDHDVAGTMTNAWWINSLGGVGSGAGGL
jgi:hypothetical protein